MGKMLNYCNEEVMFEGCPGCSYANHNFKLPCGIAYENENFILSQDWELPIQGFMIVSPKKHVEKLEEFTTLERNELFDIINKTISILRNHKICSHFNVVFAEKENRHSHVWIMPRHSWMKDITNNIIEGIAPIFEYAKSYLRTKENYKKINETIQIVRSEYEVDTLFEMAKLTAKYADKSITGDFGDIIYFSVNQAFQKPKVKFYGGTKETSYIDKSPSLLFDENGAGKVELKSWMNKENCPNAFDSNYIQIVQEFVNRQLPLLLLIWFRKLDETEVLEYFNGKVAYGCLLQTIKISRKIKNELLLCKNNQELHRFCIKYKLYSF